MTQLNFINTLPCQVNISYMNDNQVKWIEINATSYSFERDLIDRSIDITAQLISSTDCQEMNFTTPMWTGMIKGASTKVSVRTMTSELASLINGAIENSRHFLLSSLVTMVNWIWCDWKTRSHWINPVQANRGLGKIFCTASFTNYFLVMV